MIAHGLPAKAIVEGPPARNCPILLRQTAFKALDEPVQFPAEDGSFAEGTHTARFGEIEQRGVALTPKGRALYDSLLAETREHVLPAADGSNATAYVATLNDVFAAFPDDWRTLHDEGLAYFKYTVANDAETQSNDISVLLDRGVLTLSPIIYEDFLPVSAAGIFQSNLGDEAKDDHHAKASQAAFEQALGQPVADEFALYAHLQSASLRGCLEQLAAAGAAA